MKPIAVLIIAVLVLFITACTEQPKVHHANVVLKNRVRHTARPVRNDTLTIAAVGDIMLGTSYPDSNKLSPDVAKSFKEVQRYLQSADIAFGNLEGTLLDKGNPASYKLHLKSKAYLFRMPSRYGKILRNAGFNVLSLANNHISDFDLRGINSTMNTLDANGVKYGGLLLHPTAIFKKNGITYGFCAFSPNSNVVPLLDHKNAKKIIQELNQQCDIVIVSFHGGAEGLQYEHVIKKAESYMGERRGNVYAFAHMAVDAGADIILGNGPHVSRAIEVYKNRLIAYSLGNFCTYKSVSIEGVCGKAPLLLAKMNKQGEFLTGRIISFKQDHATGLSKDPQQRAFMRIKELTLADLPEAGLVFDDDGRISKSP